MRRVGGTSKEEKLSRGVSSRTLDLCAKAMQRLDGPKYDLRSTVWGLQVKDLSYYPQACFDYVITSSDVANRFKPNADDTYFPKSASFYSQLPIDPGFAVVYSTGPIAWQVQGPEITIYNVLSKCE